MPHDCNNEDYDMNENREEYISRMKDEGFEVKYPDPNELFIDLDTEEHYMLFRRQLDSLEKAYPGVSINIYPSRGGLPGRHVIVQMPFNMSDVERIAWQSILGSDPFREFMSMIRHKHHDVAPTLFVEMPKE